MISNTHVLIHLISIPFIITIVWSINNNSPVSLLLSCGSSAPATDSDGRNWIPDSSFLFSSSNDSIAAIARSQDPSLPSTVPYMTARIFKNTSTYKFSVSPNTRHWIRLHFYPSTYNNSNSSDSYFSFTAADSILLNNFSAYITALAFTQSYIVREFSLNPTPSTFLDLTFTPNDHSFAFINGIELLSMPGIFHSAAAIGFSDHSMDIENNSFQTMARLNVGGQFISPEDDSGLARTWYNDMPYLFGSATGVVAEADKKVNISYTTDVPSYIAPLNVYRTARTMGPNPEINKNYRLSWLFSVDKNFMYLVRLHFCEFQLSKINQRVFDIFINNKTAFSSADVIAWAGRQGVPIYEDFAIFVRNEEELSVALGPNVELRPEFYDSILNGLEVFKISDQNRNLAGPNPVPSSMPSVASSDPNKALPRTKVRGMVISVVLGVVAGIVIIGVVSVVFIKRGKVMNNRDRSSSSGWLPIYGSPSSWWTNSNFSGKSSGSSSHVSNLSGGRCRHFTLAEIKFATNNFDESQVIGVGGYGKVYRGLVVGKTEVAIKRSNPSSEQGINEFLTEIELLSKLRHQHLVSLIGACEENGEMILVYDYMANGTLREHLCNTEKHPHLSWKQRLDICIGAARGLHYLHTGAKYTIIHRDVKTTNILLDENWVAKVSDFGLSKTGASLDQTHVTTMVKGSFGYLDPEYFYRQQLTEKSDVYSFGVVLFEVLSGRQALDSSRPIDQVSLADWALHCHNNGNLEEIIDPRIKQEINQECLTCFIDNAAKCLSEIGFHRPSMGTVLWNLEFARQLQYNPDGPKKVAEQKANDAYIRHAALLSIEEESDMEDTEEM